MANIKGFFTKVRNLKKEDIKEHFKKRKERRQMILEKRRNGKFAKKMQPVYKWMNRLSVPLQFLLACIINFFIEVISRLSFGEAWAYLTKTPLVFLYNSCMIFVTFTIVYLVRRRVFTRILLSVFWLFLGICNGYLLTKRVTPFNAQDLKVLSDALELTGNYFNTFELIMIIIGVTALIVWVVSMWKRGGQYTGKMHRWIALGGVVASFVGCMALTNLAIDKRVISNYFGNIAFAYEDYGFPYCFSASLFNTGINEPTGYGKETMEKINEEEKLTKSSTGRSEEQRPNIIFVQLESFFDPTEVEWLRFSEDPIPNFHNLESNYSTGYLTVPVVGAGTANTEFEVLTGMSMQYFGTGEYPYKTILKQTDCESIASDLSKIGYGTHVVHNNTATFYSRNNAFSMMGFDTFTSKELMNITQYTPNGNWPTDDILVQETVKALDSTKDQSDFVYTITVEGHGDYPTEKILTDPAIKVSGAATEESNNQWEYYVNMIHEVDDFIGDLITAVDRRGEDTIVVMFGDHLPTMGLSDSDMKSGDIFKTKYITWNNMGLPKEDADLTAYQLLSQITDQAGIHEGTMFNYHQTQRNSETYLNGLENLQYDLLYGKRYTYGGEDLYPATDLQMDVEDVTISNLRKNSDRNILAVYGSRFTKNAKIFVNGEKVPTNYISSALVTTSLDNVKDGDTISVNVLGSKGILLRAGADEVVYEDPDVIHETETEDPTETTEVTVPASTWNLNMPSSEKTDMKSSESTEVKSSENISDTLGR